LDKVRIINLFIGITFRNHCRLTPSKLVILRIGCSCADLVAFRIKLIAFNDQLVALSHFLDLSI